jgi:hypothetical protein
MVVVVLLFHIRLTEEAVVAMVGTLAYVPLLLLLQNQGFVVLGNVL